ncbi:hypothetical protein QWI17_23110 [Gilvimarinus sp. SDUM040013]|uniref:DUF7931 domain-containing protein n=1 Tax=Gilvimarinus gilvus TaxID=3058038 RepID=A0ABU4S2I6_9GAMM|nr:hypothetical protein [Gilvimarinus sp. SDUM040013]MDO3388755.1 hypothetical protein [Gilvimarinus sp. SDUM040013]MDX6851370.1 hypothetical protein [Gilvimarinus sp. SDUM040013]
MSRVSQSSKQLILLESLDDLVEHSIAVIEKARRRIFLLSDTLDPHLYDRDDMTTALSAFARRSRNSDLRMLVRDSDDLVERGHRLARLHQRLSTKVKLRIMTIEPGNSQMAYLLADSNLLVYKNDDMVHQGFANYAAGSEVKPIAEEFLRIWEFANEIPDLRTLHL